MIDSEEQRRICVEVFEQTGYKIDDDDPVVVAGLFYSSRLKVAIERHEKVATTLVQRMEADRIEYERRIEALIAQATAVQDERISQVVQKYEEVSARSLATFTSSAAAERKAIEAKFAEMVVVAKQSALGEVPAIKSDLASFIKKLKDSIPSSEHQALTISIPVFLTCLALCALATCLACYIFVVNSPSDVTAAHALAIDSQSMERQPIAQPSSVKKEAHK